MWSIQDAWRLLNKMPMLENASLATCETWELTKGTRTVSTNSQQEGIVWNSVTFVGVLNAIVGIIAIQDGRCAT
jgi:hypothetical protein